MLANLIGVQALLTAEPRHRVVQEQESMPALDIIITGDCVATDGDCRVHHLLPYLRDELRHITISTRPGKMGVYCALSEAT